MQKLLKKIWDDSVGSKVIAAGIILVLSQIGIFVWGLIAKIKFIDVYSNIYKFFKTEYILSGSYIFILYSIILGLIISIIFRILRNYQNKGPNSGKEIDKIKQSDEPKIFEIGEAPTVFFHNRFCDAFPGFSYGYKWFDSTCHIHKRLSILLRKPVSFNIGEGHGIDKKPIWWFRGSSALPIEKFEILSRKRCLMNIDELKIEKIAAFRGQSYYQDFVYVQCKSDEPTGLYEYNQKHIKECFDNDNDYQEEFGIYKGNYITRQEYDDGSALIKGNPVRTEGAVLRSRNLTKYNFIIAAKFSPYNCQDFSRNSGVYFGRLLREEIEFDEFIEWMKNFEKNHNDY